MPYVYDEDDSSKLPERVFDMQLEFVSFASMRIVAETEEEALEYVKVMGQNEKVDACYWSELNEGTYQHSKTIVAEEFTVCDCADDQTCGCCEEDPDGS